MLENHDKLFLKALVFTAMSENNDDIKSFSDKVEKNYMTLKELCMKPVKYNKDVSSSL